MHIVGKAMTFRVEIDSAKDLPQELCKNVFVTYALYFEKGKISTPEFEGKNKNPQFKFKQLHHIDPVTQGILDYLVNDQVKITIFS